MPGASAIAVAPWIQVAALRDGAALLQALGSNGLGAGETSAVQLAKEPGVPLVLMDEWRGRKFALASGLAGVGCVGLLEELYRRGFLRDLREAYQLLLREKIRIDLRTLQSSLKQFHLPAL